MALFALSDTHLSLSVDKPMNIFGSRWTDHHKKIELAWNSMVKEEDTVVIGGDISWGIDLEEAKSDLLFIANLTGKKIFVKGNHDLWWNSLTKINNLFDELGITNIDLLQNNYFKRDGFLICGTRGWYVDPSNSPKDTSFEKLIKREAARLEMSIQSSLNDDGERIVFLHFPPVFQDFVYRELIDVLHKYGVKRCFYGHLHGMYKIPKEFAFEGIEFTLVSADYLNFVPFLIKLS